MTGIEGHSPENEAANAELVFQENFLVDRIQHLGMTSPQSEVTSGYPTPSIYLVSQPIVIPVCYILNFKPPLSLPIVLKSRTLFPTDGKGEGLGHCGVG